MNITEDDRTTYVDHDMVQRGLADVVPLKVTFRGAPESQITAMNAIEAHFRVYQYRKDNGVTFGDYELFFWCGCDNRTGERDMRYFYLMFNDKQSLEERERVCSRLRFFLDGYSGGDVCFEYHSEKNPEAIKAEAMRILAWLELGQMVNYRGQRGRLKWSRDNGYYFMRAGARKYGYRLDWAAICGITVA